MSSPWWNIAGFLVAPLLLGLLLLTYLFQPEFYLKYILIEEHREYQAVELLTFAAALSAWVLLSWCTLRLWRGAQRLARLSAMALGLITLAVFFFAGEEISWGQTYLGWDTPDSYLEYSYETNLHNTDLPVRFLANAFLIGIFFMLPVVYHLRPRALPKWLEPIVPEWPVAFCMLCGFLWRLLKISYRGLVPDADEIAFNAEFLESLNEHKEMIVAVAMLMYAMYRPRAIRRVFIRNGPSVHSASIEH